MAESNIVGNLEVVDQRRVFCGWAFTPDLAEGERLRIIVRRGDEIVAEGTPHIVRPDIDATPGNPTGFQVTVKTPLDPADFLEGRVTIVASDGLSEQALAIPGDAYDPFKIQLAHDILASLARPLSHRLMQELVAGRDQVNAVLMGVETEVGPEVVPDAVSQVQLPVGLLSRDGSTVLGEDGTLFLLRGRSDEVARLYERSDANLARASEAGAGWRALFASREARLGSRYVQFIIPEKQSVQGRLIVPPVTEITPLLAAVEADVGTSYLPLLQPLRDRDFVERTFRRIDSHLSTAGAESIATALASRLGTPAPVIDGVATAIRDGDIGRELLRTPLWETCLEATGLAGAGTPEVVESFYPALGKHIGQRHVFRNAQPLCDLKVVCFGNSFCDRGQTSGHLTWWFARMFSEFHFIWDAAVDDAYVDVVGADLVLGQAIERYLLRVPKT